MKLISAGGSPRMQKALSHPYVHNIVDLLLQEWSLLAPIARLLKKYDRRAQPGLTEDLEALQLDGKEFRPEDVTKLIQTLHKLYQQPYEDIVYQRGAIVELLTYELVRPRYKPGECLSNQR